MYHKLTSKIVFLLLVTAVISLQSAASFSENKKLHIVYNSGWPPYSSGDDEQVNGILVKLLDEIIGNKMGIPVVSTGYPWKRAQIFVQQGRADAFITVPTKERLKYAESSENTAYTIKMKLFTNKESPKVNALKAVEKPTELSNFSICEIIGNGWGEQFNKKNNIQASIAPTISNCFNMLSNNRADAVIHSEAVGKLEAKRLAVNNILMLSKVYGTMEFTLMVSKKSPFYKKLIPKFDETINIMIADGSYRALIEKIQNSLQ